VASKMDPTAASGPVGRRKFLSVMPKAERCNEQ
jgi:hypothetical protein